METSTRGALGPRTNPGIRIAPNPVVATAVEPAVPPSEVAPAAQPQPQPPRAALFAHGDPSEAPPPAFDPAALAILAEARGKDRLSAELLDGLAYLDGLMAAAVRAILAAGHKAPAVARAVHLASYRTAYGRRLEALGASAPAAPAIPLDLLRYVEHADPAPAIRSELGRARADLAAAAADIDRMTAIAGGDVRYFDWAPAGSRMVLPAIAAALPGAGFPATSDGANRAILASLAGIAGHWPHITRGPQDALLVALSEALTRKAEAEARISGLAADLAQVVDRRAAYVAEAVRDAGGPSALTAAVHAALSLAGAPAATSPELAALAADIERLEKEGLAESPAAGQLRGRQAELDSLAEADRSGQASRRKGKAVELVQSAIAGDEAARAELEALAVRVPRAFAAGFANALADARFDRAVIALLETFLAGPWVKDV